MGVNLPAHLVVIKGTRYYCGCQESNLEQNGNAWHSVIDWADRLRLQGVWERLVLTDDWPCWSTSIRHRRRCSDHDTKTSWSIRACKIDEFVFRMWNDMRIWQRDVKSLRVSWNLVLLSTWMQRLFWELSRVSLWRLNGSEAHSCISGWDLESVESKSKSSTIGYKESSAVWNANENC